MPVRRDFAAAAVSRVNIRQAVREGAMSTLLRVLTDVSIGAISGAGGGALGGTVGAFYAGYYFSVARLIGNPGRLKVAGANVILGARLGGLLGLVIGGITGGSGHLWLGLVLAAILTSALYLQIRNDVGKPIVLVTLIVGYGGLAGALAGYAGTWIAGRFLPDSHVAALEAPVTHATQGMLEDARVLARGLLENVSASTLEILEFVALLSLLLLIIAWAVDRWRATKTSQPSRFNPQLLSPTAANAFFGLLIGIPAFAYARSLPTLAILIWGVGSAIKLIADRVGSSKRPR
jgi:hypothetical protein